LSILIAAILVGVALRVIWALILPYNDAPDEYCHWPMVAYLAEHHHPPTMKDVPSPIPVSYPAMSSIGYIIPAIGAAIVGEDEPNAYLAARFAQALLGSLFLWLTYRASADAFPGDSLISLIVVWLASLHPQLVFSFAYVNNDASMLTVSAGLWWVVMRIARQGFRPSLGGWAAGLFALAILCKTNAIGLAILFLPILFLMLIDGPYSRRRSVATMVASFVLVTLPWWVFSLYHHRSLYGFDVHAHWWRNYILEKNIPQGFLTFDQLGTFLVDTWESSWASFGYTSVQIESVAYLLATSLAAMALGLLIARPRMIATRVSLFLVAGFVGVWIAHIYHSMTVGMAAQGRYVLPATFSVLMLLAAGTQAIGRSTVSRTWAGLGVVLIVGWFQYLSYHAEEKSNRILQPDRRVRARLVAFSGDLPGKLGSPPIQYQPIGTIQESPLGDRIVLETTEGSAFRWPVAVPASSVGGILIDQHWIGGTLPHGRLRVISADGAGVPLGEIPCVDPIIGRIRLRFDLRRLTTTLGDRPIWIEYVPSDQKARLVIPAWSLLTPDLSPWN
jgi:hypothetical protein